jgi:hypothetical protein
MKIEKGVMVVKDGKGWGINYEDGHSTSYGWIPLEDAQLYDHRYCKHPTDATYQGSLDTKELGTGKLVRVERRTEVILDKTD